MFRYGPLHAADKERDPQGRRRAITIFRQSAHEVTVVAGLLHETSSDKPSAEILREDYFTGQKVSFGDWRSIWGFIGDSEYAPLLEQIRARIAAIEAEGSPLQEP